MKGQKFFTYREVKSFLKSFGSSERRRGEILSEGQTSRPSRLFAKSHRWCFHRLSTHGTTILRHDRSNRERQEPWTFIRKQDLRVGEYVFQDSEKHQKHPRCLHIVVLNPQASDNLQSFFFLNTGWEDLLPTTFSFIFKLHWTESVWWKIVSKSMSIFFMFWIISFKKIKSHLQGYKMSKKVFYEEG